MNKKNITGSQKGQSILESAITMIILMVLVFGIIDLARLGYVVLHLNGAAAAAGRAVSVNKGPVKAAEVIMLATELKSGVMDIFTAGPTKTTITGSGGGIADALYKGLGWKPLSPENKNVTVASGSLKYEFFPIYRSNPIFWAPIKCSYRTLVEVPTKVPPY